MTALFLGMMISLGEFDLQAGDEERRRDGSEHLLEVNILKVELLSENGLKVGARVRRARHSLLSLL